MAVGYYRLPCSCFCYGMYFLAGTIKNILEMVFGK